MKQITLPLGEYAVLTGFLHEPDGEFPNISSFPAILVLPGGGFRVCSHREGEPVALAYYSAGYQAFVLEYTTVTAKPAATIQDPLNDAQAALHHLRTHCEEYNMTPGRLAMIGFSGGGHLAAAAATHGPERPDALLLGYPGIISSKLRALDCPDILESVDEHTPETFLFGMHGDSVTPPEHILSFAQALNNANIPFELHMFRGKGHGLSLASSYTSAGFASDVNPEFAQWLPMSLRWLKDVLGDFLLYGVNDGRASAYHIDRTVAELLANEEARTVCLRAMPVLAAFSDPKTGSEMTPRRINSFMSVLSQEQLASLDRELSQIR